MNFHCKIINGSRLFSQAIHYELKNSNSQLSQITVRNVRLDEFCVHEVLNEAIVFEKYMAFFQVGANF